MDARLGMLFLGVALALIGLVVLAVVRVGFMRLDSTAGVGRDGFRPSSKMPFWRLPDHTGRLRGTPSVDARWQLLLFADRSLVAFPGIVAGVCHLAANNSDLEAIILSRDSPELCEAMIQGLNLSVPVVPVDQSFYNRFRVRLMPFAFFLDPQGIVRWVGPVHIETQLNMSWQMARASSHASTVDKVSI